MKKKREGGARGMMLRLSNAAGKHLDRRTRRGRTRGDKRRQAIKDSRDT